MLPDPKNAAGVAALALAAIALLGASTAHPAPTPLAEVAVNDGQLTLLWGHAERQGQNAVGYLVARNTSDEPVQIVAVTSTDAATVGWTMKQQVLTLADLYSTGSVCSPDPAIQQAANQQTRDLRNLYVPAHGTLILRRGSGSLTFTGLSPTVHRGSSIQVQLYLVGASVPTDTRLVTAIPT